MNQPPTMPGELTEEDMMGDVEAVTEQKKPELIENPAREALEARLTETEQALSQEKERTLRALADVENIRRRAERDVADAHKYAVAKLLEELIPVMDSLEQSLTVQESDHALVKTMREGMQLTLQMLQKALTKFGVKEIYPINEAFDPAFHEVMLAKEDAEAAPNTVLEVLQKGYQLHNRVIRPARVMIAKAAA